LGSCDIDGNEKADELAILAILVDTNFVAGTVLGLIRIFSDSSFRAY
jgi:hypothetical protein